MPKNTRGSLLPEDSEVPEVPETEQELGQTLLNPAHVCISFSLSLSLCLSLCVNKMEAH
jgi:hypothetical protein